MRAVLTFFAIAVTFVGCNRSIPTEVAHPVAGYDFEVLRVGGGLTKGQAAEFSVQDGTNVTELKDGRLTVNGKRYGNIPDGKKILVDEDGAVTLDGQPRSPE